MVHVVGVTLSTITASGSQRTGSFCCCNIAYHYFLRYDIGVVHVVVVILSTITV